MKKRKYYKSVTKKSYKKKMIIKDVPVFNDYSEDKIIQKLKML